MQEQAGGMAEGASAEPARRTHEVRDTVALTAEEQSLLGTLLDAARASGSGTVLRCAGGWVRDKLLGRESVDIDVALDNMMGRQFADVVNAHLKSLGKESRHAAVIESNPEQSKHLETARMKVDGLWIDLVNLRSETYASNSRIPIVEFGTPEQDALRRDFTINALFYNINDGCVEDFTGRGLDDLRAGIIRTPLTPMETFLDDPLRVLRAVRFGTRFGFELEQSLVEAASSEQVCAALASKVSKERVGTELEGMIQGPDPVGAVMLLDRLGLFTTVFALPEPQANLLPKAEVSRTSVACARAAAALSSELDLCLEAEERRFLMLAALLLPLRGVTVDGAKNKPVAATVHIVRDSIKWRTKDADTVQVLHEAAQELAAVAAHLPASSDDHALRVALGGAIRKLKQHWRLGVVLASLLSMRGAAPLSEAAAQASGLGTPLDSSGGGSGEAHAGTHELSAAAHGARVESARAVLSAVAAFGLEDCWQWKPLLDGKQVMSLLGLKGGPALGRAVADVMDWQLAHPGGSVEQVTEHLKAKHAAESAM